MEKYDIAVLGGGVAGYSAALHAVEMGAKACLIEKAQIGGTSIKRHYPLIVARDYLRTGVDATVHERNDFFDNMRLATDSLVREWSKTLEKKGVNLKRGNGTLINNSGILVQSDGVDEVVSASKIIVACGSTPVSMPSLPFDGERIVSEDEILRDREIPEHILIIGASVGLCEAAVLLSWLGSKVIVCHEGRAIIDGYDPEVSAALESAMKRRKIKLIHGKKPISIYKNNGKIDVNLEGDIRLTADKIIQGVSRYANSGMIDSRLGIRLGERNELLTNEKMETTLAGVYAAGSVTGCTPGPLLAEEEGRIAVKNALGKCKSLNRDLVPLIIRTDTEIASIGCTVANAHYLGFRAVSGYYEYKALEDSIISRESVGFFKIIADKTTKKVIGAQIVGQGAGEIITLVVLAIKKGMSVSDLAAISCAWPSRFQGIKRAARNCLDSLIENRKLG